MCVCVCHPRVSFRRVTVSIPRGGNQEHVALRGQLVPQRAIVAAPSRWVVVSVEARSEWNRAENGRHIIVEEKERPTRGRFHAEGGVAKAGMHCAVFWTPRAAAAAGRSGERGGVGDETRRGETRRSVSGWAPRERASDCSGLADRDLCPVSVNTAAEFVPQKLLLVPTATSRTASPPNGSHDAHAPRGTAVRRTAAGRGNRHSPIPVTGVGHCF